MISLPSKQSINPCQPNHQFHRHCLPCPIPFHNPNPNFCTMSTSPSSLFTPTVYSHSLLRPGSFVSFISSNPIQNQRRFRNHSVPLSASAVSERRNAADLSWCHPPANDDYAGWEIVDTPIIKPKKGLSTFVIAGVGTSIAILIAAIAHFSLSRQGFRLHFGIPLHGILRPSGTEENYGEALDSDTSSGDFSISEANQETASDALGGTPESAYVEKVERVIIPVAMDPTQQEALSVLKKLKVVEDDVKADELCTRREFARWLVRANSLLERNPKYKIFPSALLSGTTIAAFDDISVEDPDFGSIQALAEAGVILSKLAGKSSSSDPDGSEGHGGVYFFPDSFISRQDLIDWKAQLDYKFKPVIEEKISRTKVPFMDVKEISTDASPGFFMDVLASDKSILRKVFGRLKRFQPNKPSTKAQAAVALTSGRMTKAIQAESSRLEAENISRQVEMEEIKSELIDRGDIKNFWDQKLKEEKTRGFNVEKACLAAIYDLEQEKIVQEKSLAEFLKEKAAMDCQRQLLHSLKEEVYEMSKRLEYERVNYMDEQRNVKDTLSDLLTKLEGLLDAKAILEAEKEALQILRSWVEDEARKSQARAKVLEEVTRRWRWESQA